MIRVEPEYSIEDTALFGPDAVPGLAVEDLGIEGLVQRASRDDGLFLAHQIHQRLAPTIVLDGRYFPTIWN